MINTFIKEYVKDNMAIREISTKFLGIPIWKYKKTSTSGEAVNQLTPTKERVKIKGFKHETKD